MIKTLLALAVALNIAICPASNLRFCSGWVEAGNLEDNGQQSVVLSTDDGNLWEYVGRYGEDGERILIVFDDCGTDAVEDDQILGWLVLD